MLKSKRWSCREKACRQKELGANLWMWLYAYGADLKTTRIVMLYRAYKLEKCRLNYGA